MDIDTENPNDIVKASEELLYTLFPAFFEKIGSKERALEIIDGKYIYQNPIEEIPILDLNLHLIYQENLFTFRQMFCVQGKYPTEDMVEEIVKNKIVEAELARQSKQFESCDYPLMTREEIEARVDYCMHHLETITYREWIRDGVKETSLLDTFYHNRTRSSEQKQSRGMSH